MFSLINKMKFIVSDRSRANVRWDASTKKVSQTVALSVCVGVILSCSTLCAQFDNSSVNHAVDIEAAKASLMKIGNAIDQMDFATVESLMTKKGADELAVSVVSFAMLVNDPEIGKTYPSEFDPIREKLKQPLVKHGLDVSVKSLGNPPMKKTLEIIDTGNSRWQIVAEIWEIAKDAPMGVILIRGPVQRSDYEEDSVFLQVARQAVGESKKYDIGAAPSVVRFAKQAGIWKFDGIDEGKTALVAKAHAEKMANMPAPLTDPTFEGKTSDSQSVTFAQYDGKVVVIDFWGTWCAPCLAKLPALVKIREAFKPHGFEIVGFASDSAEDLQAYLDKSPLPWKNVVDDGKFKQQFGVKAYPTLFLIDKQKKHVASNLELTELVDAIANALELPPENYTDLKKEVAKASGH